MKIHEILDQNDPHDTWAVLQFENIGIFDLLYDEVAVVSNNFTIDPDTVNPELFADLYHDINHLASEIILLFATGSKWHNKAIKILAYLASYE